MNGIAAECRSNLVLDQQRIRRAIASFKDIVRDLPQEKQHTLRNILVLDALEDFEELLNAAS